MNETQYRRKLVRKIEQMFPGCMVILNDPQTRQGIPDLLILFEGFWAALEVKIDSKANVQPNQAHYVDRMRKMSFASFINPATERVVLDELQHALTPRRASRVS